MTTLAEREQLARIVLEAADALALEAQAGPRRVTDIWAVVPVKEFDGAKQRLSPCSRPTQRRALATMMLEDVLDAVSAVPRALPACWSSRSTPTATSLAPRLWRARRHRRRARRPYRRRHRRRASARPRGPRRHDDDARRHSAPVVGRDRPRRSRRTAPRLPSRSCPRMTISDRTPIICSPPDAVPLRFGEDSFYPHLDAARAPRDRTARRPPTGDRDGHRQSRRSRRRSCRMSPSVPHADARRFSSRSGVAGRLLATS